MITPYEVADKPVKRPDQKEKCASCGYAIVGADYYKVDGKVYHSGCDRHDNKNVNSNQPDKKTPQEEESKVIKLLVQYFQQHSIKKIKLVNGELVIMHNNNKTLTTKEVDDDQELQLVRDMVKKSNKQELIKEELEKMVNNNSNSSSTTPNNNKL